MTIAVRNVPRADRAVIDTLGQFGVATIHEAQGRTGLMDASLRPIYRPVRIAGSAITCAVAPGDNWSIHVAAELCQPGDILVVAPTSPCDDGYFGDLLACSLQARAVKGLVIDAGVRDIAVLTEMGFPVWSKAVCAQGTVKATLGDVNLPMVCGGRLVSPGDVIIADDDGVVVVPRDTAADIAARSAQREDKEADIRRRLLNGEASLDVFGLREGLVAKGLSYREI